MKREEKQKLKAKELQEKHLEETIKKNIPVEELEFLVQPLAWTMLKGDITKTQYVLMENLMDAFQEKFRAQIAANKKKITQQPTLFGDDGQLPVIRVYFKELGVRADSYEEVHQAALELGKQIIEVPGINEDGDLVTNYIPLFSKISVPQKTLDTIERKEGAERMPYKENKRRRGYVEIKVNAEVGAEYFEIKGLHTKFLKNVAKKCSCDYSPRMYLYAATWRDLGGKWEFDFIVFRRLLGLRKLVAVKKDGNTVYEERDLKYENFSDVKRHILDKTMKELKRLADNDELDCYFSYEVVMPKGKTRGWPEKLRFYSHKSKLGERVSAYNNGVQMNMKLESLMIKELKMSKQSAVSLTDRLTEDTRLKFSNKLMELISFITNPDNKIKDTGGYAFVALSNYLEEITPSAEEIVPEKSPTLDNIQPNEKVQENKGNKEVVGENSGNEERVGNYSAEALPMWYKVLDFIRERMARELFDIHILPLYPYSFGNDKLVIAAPNEYIYREVQTKYAPRLLEIIRECFGKQIEVEYVRDDRRTKEMILLYEERCKK